MLRLVAICLTLVMLVSTFVPLVDALDLSFGEDIAYICGMEEHEHDESCYGENVIAYLCESEYGSSRVLHEHDSLCYDDSGRLICYLDEVEPHEHDESCYEPVEDDVLPGDETPGGDPVETPDDGQGEDEVDIEQDAGEGEAVPDEDDGEGEAKPDEDAGSGEIPAEPETQEPESQDNEITSGDDKVAETDEEDVVESDNAIADSGEPDDIIAAYVPSSGPELVCELRDTSDWVVHQHNDDCIEVQSEGLVCDKPEHEHVDECIVVMTKDADIDAFCDRITLFGQKYDAGKYDDDPDAFQAEYEAILALVDEFKYLTEEQAARIQNALMELEALRERAMTMGLAADFVEFTPLIINQAISSYYSGEFVFEIIPCGNYEDAVVMPESLELVISGAGEKSGEFDKIVFNAPGEYEFKLDCVSVSKDFRRDDRTWRLVVTVEDTGDGLAATGTYYLDSFNLQRVDGAEFINPSVHRESYSSDTRSKARAVLNSMTLEEKVGQLFLLHYPASGAGNVAAAKNLIDKYHPGGFLVFAAMFEKSTPDEVRNKIADTQALSKTGLLFTVDEEGGGVVRVSKYPAYGVTKFMSPMELKASGGLPAVAADAVQKAKLLLDLGLNVNHWPVADVSGEGGMMYSRTWGGDGVENAKYVETAVRAGEGAGLVTTMKHFPGYGGSASDTHAGTDVNNLSLDEFMYNDLLPFYAGMAAGGSTVMVSHNIITCLDSSNPASLSPAVYDLLRNTMNYDGVAMTDDLAMGAITKTVKSGQASLMALKAGADMAMTASPETDYSVVLAAAQSGELSMSDIEEKCLRILCMKIEMGLEMPDVSVGERHDAEAQYYNSNGELVTGSFNDAWYEATHNGGPVTLLSNCAVNGGATISGVDVELYLDGFTVTINGDGNAPAVNITNGGSLEIIDGKRTRMLMAGAGDSKYDASAGKIEYRTMDSSGQVQAHEVDLGNVGGVQGVGSDGGIKVTNGKFTMSGGRLTSAGVGIYVADSSSAVAEINDGFIVGCSKNGVAVYGSGTVNMNGGYIAGNKAEYGGGVYVYDGRFNMSGGVICANDATVHGGGVYVFSSSVSSNSRGFYMTGGYVAGNTAYDSGGGIANFGSTVDLSGNAVVTCNTATTSHGGGISNRSDGVDVGLSTIYRQSDNVLVSGNKSVYGGGVCGGDQVFTISVLGGTICYNYASSQGGGLYAAEKLTNMVVNGAYVQHNEAGAYGGGIYILGGEVSLQTADITDNIAPEGAGVSYVSGLFYMSGLVRITGNRLSADGELSNVCLPKDHYVGISGWLEPGSEIGITVHEYPADGDFLDVVKMKAEGASARIYAAMFKSDKPEYAVGAKDKNLVIGKWSDIEALVGDIGILFQYYAEVYSPDASLDGALTTLPVINTSGKMLPQNGNGSSLRPRYLYIGQDYKVSMHASWVPVYEDVNYVAGVDEPAIPDIRGFTRMDEIEKQYYDIERVLVSDDINNRSSVDESKFKSYVFTENSYLTANTEDKDPNAIIITDQSVVRFMLDSVSGDYDVAANFYDYDISNGAFYKSKTDGQTPVNAQYTSTQAAHEASGGTSYMRTGKEGINSDENYGDGVKLAFGNANTATGREGESWSGNSLNQYNRTGGGYNGCTFGLVSHMENGHVVYTSGVTAPNLFDEGPAVGKTNIMGHSMQFSRIGDTYTLMGVSGTDTNKLDEFHPYTGVWSNHFWPMDSAPTWGADGHDIKFGAGTAKTTGNGYTALASRRIANKTSSDVTPVSDCGEDHNHYFGMNFEITFQLNEDYIAPLSYWFFGDDDLWVFLDGELVCDIGGVHSSVGEYVNLRDYMPEGTSGVHVLSVYYTERGASGSSCWMQFQLPHPLGVTTRPPVDEEIDTGDVSITKAVEGVFAEDDQFKIQVYLTDNDGNDLTGAYVYSGSSAGMIQSGGYITLKKNDIITITQLPLGTHVRIREMMTSAQEEVWSEDVSKGQYSCEISLEKSELKVVNIYEGKHISGLLPNTGGSGLAMIYFVGGWCAVIASWVMLFRLHRKEKYA